MGISAISKLPEAEGISDQDLFMVSHTDDGGISYSSGRLAYEDMAADMYVRVFDKIQDFSTNMLPLVWTDNIAVNNTSSEIGGTDVIAFYDVADKWDGLTPSLSTFTRCNVPFESWVVYRINGQVFRLKTKMSGSGLKYRTANYAKMGGMEKTTLEIPISGLNDLSSSLSGYFTSLSVNSAEYSTYTQYKLYSATQSPNYLVYMTVPSTLSYSYPCRVDESVKTFAANTAFARKTQVKNTFTVGLKNIARIYHTDPSSKEEVEPLSG